jgi:phosphomannomutase
MSIFRAYDIRGIYGKDLTEEIMEKIGMAVGTYSPGTFTVGRDFRTHGKKLEDAFISGVLKTGSNVEIVEIGPTILPVFENWSKKNDVAAYVTGSHLTAEWNGIKFFRQNGVGFFEDENKKLEKIVLSGDFKISKKQGTIKQVKDAEDSYIKFIKERIKPKKIKVVIDFGNGAACLLVPKIIKALGNVEAKYIFDKPDPNFVNRSPEPDVNSLTELEKAVKREKADLGIGFDGDGDRAMFVDDKGNFLLPEESSILFIRDIMKSKKGPVVVNVECSSTIDNEVRKFKQRTIRIPVGHTFLVQESKNNNAVFGLEKSGHICIPKFYWFDDAIINSMYMIEIVSKLHQKISEIM